MMSKNYISLDTSILYRSNQRYFDDILSDYNIGYAHLIFLIEIYEHEGISMNELAESGSFDKGTVTKSIQKLLELGYVKIEVNENDRRSKLLFTTDKTREIILDLYRIRQDRWNYLSQDLSEDEKEQYINITSILASRSREFDLLKKEESKISFYGLQKCSLLDYPGKVSSILFTGGCNFKCPYCHNRDLVFLNENDSKIDLDYIMAFLDKRKNIIDGICVTGGEPLISVGLKSFLRDVKDMGLKVKLDTNGYYFDRLKDLIDDELIDYIAMDIKNSPSKYSETIGLNELNLDNIRKSIKLIMNSGLDYEFRTTVVKEYHDIDAIEAIAKMINDAKHYFIQNFVDRDSCIKKGLHGFNEEELNEFKVIAAKYIKEVEIR